MYRYPPAGWLPLSATQEFSQAGPSSPTLQWTFKEEVPWLEYTLVGFSWAATAPIKLLDFKVGGGALLNFGENPMPLRRHGWLLGSRFWPKVHPPNSPIIVIEAEEAPEVSALIVPFRDAAVRNSLELVSEEGVQAFAQNMGTLQMWDSWPGCVEHDEQALQHHADLEREWKAWIAVAAASAKEYFAQKKRRALADVDWD
jgi:hypothetical protein